MRNAHFNVSALIHIRMYEELMMSSVAAAPTTHVNMKAATRLTATTPAAVWDVCFAILTYARHRTTEAPTGTR